MKTPAAAAPSTSKIQRSVPVEANAAPLVLQLIPSAYHHQGRALDPVQLATVMRSVVLDRKRPIALEIAGTDQQRCLLIRARRQEDLRHAETQLHARLPHATFVPLAGRDDPFHIRPGETVSVVELRAGQASYFPLQEFDMQHGEDPLLGLLGAIDALPKDLRAIAQLALVPAPANWSRAYQRKAIEHALDPERQQDRWKMATARDAAGAPSIASLLLGVVILAGYFLSQRYPKLMLSWFPAAVQDLLHGQALGAGLPYLVGAGMIASLVVIFGVTLIWHRARALLSQTPLYDMRSVAEKTSRLACQVRLRLYVIGPRTTMPMEPREPYFWPFLVAFKWTSMREVPTLFRALRARQWRCTIQALGRLVRLAVQVLWYAVLSCGVVIKHDAKRLWARWCATMRERDRRNQILARLIAAYRQYHLASGNYFVPRRVSEGRARSWVRNGTWMRGVHRSRHLIDVDSLAALWHLPTDEALPNLAHMAYRQSRSRLLPPGLQAAQQEIPIGMSEHAGHRASFGLPAECLQSHMLIGGKSGEGKSTLMQHLALRAMHEKHGLIVIDPHGDLADQILALVPADRLDDVVYIDLSNERFACGLNPLDVTMARGRDKTVSDEIKIMSKIWPTGWGSRMEIAFEYALRTLFEANRVLCRQTDGQHRQYTLLDVMPLLTDESFCHSLLEYIEDPLIQRWWAIYYHPLSLQMQRDRADPVLSKMAKFESTIARHILGQSLSTVHLADCIEQQKIMLVKLAKGVVGEDVARILGAFLLGSLYITLEEQGKKDEHHRRHLPILIDEFQTLEGIDWDALAELRKYGATFCLATQSLEYLRDKQILPVVLANVKQLAIFRMSADDAWALHRELDVDPEDIVHLDTLMCYLKLSYRQKQQATFSCTVHFPPAGEKEHAQQIRDRCQERYMRPVSAIEAELFERLARQLGAVPGGMSSKKPRDPSMEQGRARQDGGNRGRKSHARRSPGEASRSTPALAGGEITPMNWEETVGQCPDDSAEEEGERDP